MAVIKRRHTSGMELSQLIDVAEDELEGEFLTLETVSKDLKMLYLKNDNEARSVIVRAAEFGVINSSDILPVFHEFKNPRHAECEEPTRWNLLNVDPDKRKKWGF